MVSLDSITIPDVQGTGPATPPCAGGIVHRVERDVRKAQALGNALLVFMVVPWTLCGIFYTGEWG